ncbi:cytoplasmic protein [Breoghania sp. L-A4]|uniref:cytoplasmic protein n=1 Tax=Breoghania sp. L-A4 TaxID=2304600 RepID=UPI000E359A4B|nr:cytoplasmic protein [Breoghania sp. L-A4]AXS41426.1 cytoplasmic protein [Breoghania sp. L-A4]
MPIRLATIMLALALATSAPAAADVYFDWNKPGAGQTDRARLPACDAAPIRAAVLRTIERADPDYRRDFSIKSLGPGSQTGFLKDRPSPLARRYCRASAETQEGARLRHRKLYYMIEEYQAFAGIGWNVEVCVAGRDRWYVHDTWCRTVRP